MVTMVKWTSRIEGAKVGVSKMHPPQERVYKNEVGETRK